VSQNELNYPSEVKYLNSRVYLGLRGDDKVMIFDEQEEGKLQQFCAFKVGQFPRHFSVTPAGYLYVACQRANLVEKYKI
jgi:6-phosphogluconolactonase (cycloisomerase 2 family)